MMSPFQSLGKRWEISGLRHTRESVALGLLLLCWSRGVLSTQQTNNIAFETGACLMAVSCTGTAVRRTEPLAAVLLLC